MYRVECIESANIFEMIEVFEDVDLCRKLITMF